MNATITLDDARSPDGTRTGRLVIGQHSWAITGWRQGGDPLHVLLNAQPVRDDWLQAFNAALDRAVSG